jgi:hypothetical protein
MLTSNSVFIDFHQPTLPFAGVPGHVLEEPERFTRRVVCEFRVRVDRAAPDSAVSHAVRSVFRGRTVADVFEPVVRRIAVQVARLMTFGTRTDKGE